MGVSGDQYCIAHRRTEESPVAKHFNSGAHVESDMTVTVVDLARSHDACLRNIQESEQINENVGNFVPFRDQSKGR